MAGINVEHDMWKHLMEVMDRLDKVETEAREQHRRDSARIKELEAKVVELEQRNAVLQNEIDRLKLLTCWLLFAHSSLITSSSPVLGLSKRAPYRNHYCDRKSHDQNRQS